jgi:hypothetical protein
MVICNFCSETINPNELCDCEGAKNSRSVLLTKSNPFSFTTIGLLGTIAADDEPLEFMKSRQIRMIECRILRIEEAIKRLGFDIESINLSDIG